MEKINLHNQSHTTLEENNLSNPRILDIFISCLKSTHKKQEIKKKKDKRLMNLFSVRVNKYEDSSSQYKTDDKFKKRKAEVAKNLNKKKRTYTSTKRITGDKLVTNPNKKFYSSAGAVEDSDLRIFKEHKNINERKKQMKEYTDYEYEMNSDSSIYTKEKFLHSNSNDEEYAYKEEYSKYKPKSAVRRNILNEKFKYLRSKFNKQIDIMKARKNSINLDVKDSRGVKDFKRSKNHAEFSKDNYKQVKNEDKCAYNIHTCTNNISYADEELNSPPLLKFLPIDNSVNNSYKSVNSAERKNPSEHFLNYYMIKRIEDDKELIFYDVDDYNQFKYDDNYKCHYSLDHKSRIIYIKPSPKLLSSISSILNSKIVSRRTNKNLSGDRSRKSVGTPNKEGQDFDHNKIVEKLKDLELAREDKEMENISRKIVYSSEGEN